MCSINLFNKIEGGVAVLRSNGVFKQVDVYQRKGHIYVKYNSGFIRVYAAYGKEWYNTTKTGVMVEELDTADVKFKKGKLGNLEVIQ